MPLHRWTIVVASTVILVVGAMFGPILYHRWSLPKMVGPITHDSAIGKALDQAFAAEKAKDYQKAAGAISRYLDREQEPSWYTITALH